MKGQLLYKIIFFLLLIPASSFAQTGSSTAGKDISGLWKGELYNDTTKKSIPFEIAISDDNGKLSGYSYTLFDIDGKKELGIKKIKIKQKDDQVIIEDVELISNNYSAPPPRGVRFTGEVTLSASDTMLFLKGLWHTNRTREYSPYNGSIQLQRSANYTPEALFKELVRLKLDQSLSFVRAPKAQQPAIAVADNATAAAKKATLTSPLNNDPDKAKDTVAVPEKKTEPIAVVKPPAPVAKPVEKPVEIVPVPEDKIAPRLLLNNLAIIKGKPSGELFKVPGGKRKSIAPLTAKNRELLFSSRDKRREEYQIAYSRAQAAPPVVKPEPVAVVKEPAKRPEPVEKPAATAPPVVATKPPVVVKEPVNQAPKPVVVATNPPVQKPAEITPNFQNAAADVAERKMKNEQSVFFESDSLVLTLYDNGEVDGDTVSVLMNGQIIFAKTGLSTKANTKTIYVDKTMGDSLSMIMYAENLGSIPPNTGLLIIMDGEKRYEVRFSADLKTNAAILLRRRKKDN